LQTEKSISGIIPGSTDGYWWVIVRFYVFFRHPFCPQQNNYLLHFEFQASAGWRMPQSEMTVPNRFLAAGAASK